jgi:hypothetical protein
MGIREWRGRMGRSVIVDAVSEMCRARSVTHILLSPDVFKEYSDAITPHHIRSGIRRGTCHSVGIIVVEDLSNEVMISFSCKRAKDAMKLLRLARMEEYDKTIDHLADVIERGAKWIHIGMVPKQHGEDDEASGK